MQDPALALVLAVTATEGVPIGACTDSVRRGMHRTRYSRCFQGSSGKPDALHLMVAPRAVAALPDSALFEILSLR